MTRDEARKLVGGYATGSLTESERRLLFEAAMEDQDLFDELAREQEMKELLDEPGARDRLILAVTPPDRGAVVKRPIWVWSAIALAAVVFGVTTWSLLRTPKPVEVARVEPHAAQPAPPVAVDQLQPSPPVSSAPPANRPATDKKSPGAPAGAPGPATEANKPAAEAKAATEVKPAAETKKDERDKSLEAAQASAPAPAAQPRPEQQSQPQQAAPPSSRSQQAPSQQAAQQTVEVQAQTGFLPSAPIAPRPGVTGGAATGGGGTGGARKLASRAGLARVVRFGFDYTIEPDVLVLKFNTDGWLSLHFAPGDDTIALAHVTAGQIRREAIPNNATEAAIVFAVEAQTDPTVGVNLTRTDKSGTVEDPSSRRIEFLLKFY